MTHHLVGSAEVGEILGVSRQRVSQIAASHDDFPSPEAALATGRVWLREAVVAWSQSRTQRQREAISMERLLEQEVAVVCSLGAGRSPRETATDLAISSKTVKRHLESVVVKLTTLLDGLPDR